MAVKNAKPRRGTSSANKGGAEKRCRQCGALMRLRFREGKRSWRCHSFTRSVEPCHATEEIRDNEQLPLRTVAIDIAMERLRGNNKERQKHQRRLPRLAENLRRFATEDVYCSSTQRRALTDSADYLEHLAAAEAMAKQEIKRMVPVPKQRAGISTLGGRLRTRRHELGWTQMYLAERVGTSQAVIQKIENGKSTRPRNLETIAHALSVSPSWLQFGEEDPDTLNAVAVEVALAWSKLPEPQRTVMRSTVLDMTGV